MDYDKDAPFALGEYRHMQRAIPGVDGLYRMLRALIETRVQPGGTILIVGAGGGREIEALSDPEPAYRLIGVDPSQGMLEQAGMVAEQRRCLDRVTLVQGTVEAVHEDVRAEAATSLLVMHFLPDDGAKLAYLRAIRARMRPGAILVHADVCFEDRMAFEAMRPAFLRHAELAGLSPAQAAISPPIIATLPIIGEARTATLFREAGFGPVTPFFRGLWYAGWWAQAS